jgi:hypothetical protein
MALTLTATVSVAGGGRPDIVWRGIAQSTVDDAASDAVRQARIHDAVAELIKRFPRKKK